MPNEAKSKLCPIRCRSSNGPDDQISKTQEPSCTIEENFAIKISLCLKNVCVSCMVMLNFRLGDKVATFLKSRLQSSLEKLVTDIIKTELVDFNQESKRVSVAEIVQWSTQVQNILNSHL